MVIISNMYFIVLLIVWMYFMGYFIWLMPIRKRHFLMMKKNRKGLRIDNLRKIINESDRNCVSQLRMDRRTFSILCEMVRDIGGLGGSRNMSLEEIVAMFLYTLAHHQKNRTIANYFDRSGETVSRQFNLCLRAILKLHGKLLKSPEPISGDCTDENWKDFKVYNIIFFIIFIICKLDKLKFFYLYLFSSCRIA